MARSAAHPTVTSEWFVLFYVVQCVEGFCSFTPALALIQRESVSLYGTQHGQEDSPPPRLHLHRKRKRQAEAISRISLTLNINDLIAC